uniref:CUB domain-containing protein n=1 Tax=Globodera pallida TaxID=36090 RepID=A0A183CRY0_GLOPA
AKGPEEVGQWLFFFHYKTFGVLKTQTSSGLSRHFDAGQSGTTETPWANNSALLFSAHYEPDAENSLMANFKAIHKNAPLNKKPQIQCQFIFVGAPDERVQIIFHYFRLKQQFPLNSRRRQNMTIRCEESDHLSAHVLLADRMSKIHDFCGDELPAQLMSAKNVLTLTYVLKSALITPNPRQNHRLWVEEGGHREGDEAKDEAEHFGWIAEYRFIGDFGAQPPEAISPIGDRSKCSFTFNGTITTTGNVWSPNYPGFYPRNVDCQYVFVGRAGQKVYITFEYFDIEGFGHCEESTQSDFVLFSNYQTRD